MGKHDPRIDRYLAKDRPWRDELVALRSVLLGEGLAEALKWREPCYIAHGANVAILSALKDAATVSFFKGVLIDDPTRLLVAPDPNTRSARYAKFRSLEDVAANADALRGLIRQAIENERVGRKVDRPADDLEYPAELKDALSADLALAAAFEELTPGRRRGYAVALSTTKQPKSRRARIEEWVPRILAGKGMHDR